MPINVEEVRVVRIVDPEKSEQIINEFSGRLKKMEEFEIAMSNWVGKVNSNMDKTNQVLDEIKENNKEESEKLSEKLNSVDESIEILKKMHAEHMEWHNKNKSVLSKIFGK